MLLASVLLISNMAHAAVVQGVTEADRMDCRNRAVQSSTITKAEKDRLNDLCLQQKAVANKIATVESKIETERDKKQECYGNRVSWTNPGSWFGGNALGSQEAIDKCKADNAAADAEIAKLRTEMTSLQRDLAAAQAQFNTANTAAGAQVAERRELNSLVNGEFDSMRLSIFDSRLRAADAATKLEKMARAIDNSAMGLYMRDRMAGLLNSPKMCEVVKACPTPSKIKGKDLNSVFSGKMETSASDVSPDNIATPAAAPASPAGTNR